MICAAVIEPGTSGRTPGFSSTADSAMPKAEPQSVPDSAVHRIDDDVYRESSVVVTLEPLVAPVVVPLAAVVLVGIQHADPAAMLDGAKVVVHQVVAPSVQFMRRLRRPVGKLKERSVEFVSDWNLVEGVGPREHPAHLLLERRGV